MSEIEASNPEKEHVEESHLSQSDETDGPKPGVISILLTEKEIDHNILESDHLGVENIGISPINLKAAIKALKNDGFDYLQCQGGYDEGPGRQLVCFYHLIAMKELALNECSIPTKKAREVRIKVFLDREGVPSLPSLYDLFKGADWQERETYDMFGINFEGHPHPKRLLMPEDWIGWPLRKDYIQPDFYEMQDAY